MIPETDKIKMAQSADEIYKRKHVPLTAAYLKKPDDHANLEDVQSGKVSIEHGDAISNYSGGLSDPVNGALRGDYIGHTVEIKAYDKALSAALESLPSWNNKTVYRMVKNVEDITPYEAYFNRTLNKVLHEPCYLSSSKEEWEDEKVIYKIKTLKKDSHARDVSRIINNACESEVLFLKDTHLLIKSVSKRRGRLYIGMEETKREADEVLNYHYDPNAPAIDPDQEELGMFD